MSAVESGLKTAQTLNRDIETRCSIPLVDALLGRQLWQSSIGKPGTHASAFQLPLLHRAMTRITQAAAEEDRRLSSAEPSRAVRGLRARLRQTQFILQDRNQLYMLRDFYQYAKTYFGELCDDLHLCSCGGPTRRPEWQHQVRFAVWDLRLAGVLLKADAHQWKFSKQAARTWSPRGEETDTQCTRLIQATPTLLSQIRTLASTDELLRWTGALTGVAPRGAKEGETKDAWLSKYQPRLEVLQELTSALGELAQATKVSLEEVWCCLRLLQYELGLNLNMNPVKLKIIHEIVRETDDETPGKSTAHRVKKRNKARQ